MKVQEHLLNVLNNMVDDDYEEFQWYLTLKVLDDCEPIQRARLQNISRNNTVSMMINAYGEESAVNLTLEILKKMNFNGIAEELRKALAAERTASPSASSPAVAPSAAGLAAPGAPGAPGAPEEDMCDLR